MYSAGPNDIFSLTDGMLVMTGKSRCYCKIYVCNILPGHAILVRYVCHNKENQANIMRYALHNRNIPAAIVMVVFKMGISQLSL